MKHFYKSGLVLFITLFSMFAVQAYDFESDGIYYNVLSKDRVAVTNAPNSKQYSGDITIPTTVSNGGYTYSVSEIGSRAFKECDYLTHVTIPNSVTLIGEMAFFYSKKLIYVSIPNSVIEIQERAFDDCLSLSHVYIPYSVTTIGKFAFRGCESSMSIEVDSENPFYTSYDGVLYNKELTTLIQCPSGKETIEIPNTVTVIEECAVSHCHNLRSVTIPESVTKIRDEAFFHCNSLENIIIPESIEEIGKDCFSNCYSLIAIEIPDSISVIKDSLCYECSALENVYLGESIIEIEDCAFTRCYSLKSIILPSSLSLIGRDVFRGCRNLNEVTCLAEEVPELGNDVFTYISSEAILYVNESVLDDYKNSEWSQYFSQILPTNDSGIKSIYDKNNTEIYRVYDTNGLNILNSGNKSEIENLPFGLYIINGKKVMIRK